MKTDARSRPHNLLILAELIDINLPLKIDTKFGIMRNVLLQHIKVDNIQIGNIRASNWNIVSNFRFREKVYFTFMILKHTQPHLRPIFLWIMPCEINIAIWYIHIIVHSMVVFCFHEEYQCNNWYKRGFHVNDSAKIVKLNCGSPSTCRSNFLCVLKGTYC